MLSGGSKLDHPRADIMGQGWGVLAEMCSRQNLGIHWLYPLTMASTTSPTRDPVAPESYGFSSSRMDVRVGP